jgi:hypothetical protein
MSQSQIKIDMNQNAGMRIEWWRYYN